jgi:hypothetical protein
MIFSCVVPFKSKEKKNSCFIIATLYLLEMEVCTARQEVYSAGMEDRQYRKKRVVLLQI